MKKIGDLPAVEVVINTGEERSSDLVEREDVIAAINEKEEEKKDDNPK